jgi:hypothetical protein
MDDEELHRFKRRDLRQYAASLGFSIDKRESSRACTVMRRDGEKIIVTRKSDGVFTYWSPHDTEDRGTVIDLIQRRTGRSLGQVRAELRTWSGSPVPVLPDLAASVGDRDAVRRRYERMSVVARHRFLEEERGIPAEALGNPRWSGLIRTDGRHGNAVFGHRDEEGICGYEERNTGWKRFSAGGVKGLFLSRCFDWDRRLYVCESAIDAISLFVLLNDPDGRFASLGGQPTRRQCELLAAAFRAMPAGSQVVAAMDADKAGHALSDRVRKVFEEVAASRTDLSFKSTEPVGAKDWNDLIRPGSKPPVSVAVEVPAVR